MFLPYDAVQSCLGYGYMSGLLLWRGWGPAGPGGRDSCFPKTSSKKACGSCLCGRAKGPRLMGPREHLGPSITCNWPPPVHTR